MKLGHDFCFVFPVHDSHGAVAPDALPTALIYEDHGGALAYAPTVALIGALTGQYYCYGTASAANGFDVGKDYNIVLTAVISGATWNSRIAQFTIEDNDIDKIATLIGTPVALDGGAATVGGMLTKMADDNGGADFDATTDSLEKIAAAISGGSFTVADIWEYIVTGLEPVGSAAELLSIAADGNSITAETIVRALLAAPQADYMVDGTIGRSIFEAAHGRVTPVIKNPVGDHIVDVDLSGVLKDKGALDRTACVAIAMDKNGRDSTSTLISKIVYLGQKARITLRGGEVAKAPYSVRIVVRTTLSFSYQHEIQVYVLGG